MAPQQNAPAPDQKDVLAFLDSRIHDATRVDTHASIVFLEQHRVLKIKRAVRLPFLDYSTLDKRKRACEEELSINRRYAPQIYRRVVPITRGAEGFHIGGDGPVVEWAVEMARFDENRTLDHLARAGGIAPELAEEVADILYAAHQSAEVSDGAAWLASMAAIIDRNSDRFRVQASVPSDATEHLHKVSHGQLAGARSLLRDRALAGLVRRCHGDAHLGNIALIDHKPVLFDAIEFDPVIATTDVLYDLAFPIMDLVHFGLNAAANRLLNRYLQRSWRENGSALRLLPLFLSIRAAIRSHVLFTKNQQSPADNGVAEEAKSYFDLALTFLRPARPSLIAIGGKSGTGKSVLARDFAALVGTPPGAVILRSDVIRKELFGVDPLVQLPAGAYIPRVTERIYDTLNDRARQIIAQGFSVIVDAAFLQEEKRDKLSTEAKGIEADFRAVFLDADRDIRLSRVGARKRDASDASSEVASQQEDYDIGQVGWTRVNASGSPQETFDRSKAFLLQ
ncbi:MAG: AAA family ATPase [Bradyrhizobium sp.]|nr:AAA family ATPase [Bradyrhizobium sp.]